MKITILQIIFTCYQRFLKELYANHSLKENGYEDSEFSYAVKSEENKDRFEEDIKRSRNSSGVVEYKASINSWRQSNEGDFIEYKIELSNFKGLDTKTLFKRYSDFVFIHDLIQKDLKEDIPPLPPRNLERTDESLRIRMKQLEDYLNSYFVKNPVNSIILEFLEVVDSDSSVFQELSRTEIKSVDFEIIKYSYLLSESKKVEAIFESKIDIYSCDKSSVTQHIFFFTYEQLKEFHDDLIRICWLGDIDGDLFKTSVGDFPSSIGAGGTKILDKDLMSLLQSYLNKIQRYNLILNPFINIMFLTFY